MQTKKSWKLGEIGKAAPPRRSHGRRQCRVIADEGLKEYRNKLRCWRQGQEHKLGGKADQHSASWQAWRPGLPASPACVTSSCALGARWGCPCCPHSSPRRRQPPRWRRCWKRGWGWGCSAGRGRLQHRRAGHGDGRRGWVARKAAECGRKQGRCSYGAPSQQQQLSSKAAALHA